MPVQYAWKDKKHYDYLEKGLLRYLHRTRINFILEILDGIGKSDIRARFKVLDLGCGDGVVTKYIAADDRFSVIGVDSDMERLNRARLILGNDKVKFMEADLARLSLKDSETDVILLHHVIEHVEDDARLLKNCFNLLRDKGTLILGIPNEDSLFGKISRFLHRALYEKGEHVHFYSERRIVDMLKEQGFEIKRIGRIGFLFPLYYLHILLVSNPITFSIGDFLTKILRFSADSLIVVAERP